MGKPSASMVVVPLFMETPVILALILDVWSIVEPGRAIGVIDTL